MKRKNKIASGILVFASALQITSCSSTPNETTSGESGSETAFNLFKSMSDIRAEVDPSKSFSAFKSDYLKSDKELKLQFMLDYVNDKQSDKPQVELKLVELSGDQLKVSDDPSLSTNENTIIISSVNVTPEELKRMPRTIKAGLNFINNTEFTPVYPVTEEFRKNLKTFNKQFGYDILDASGPIENQIGYILTGNYKFWDVGGLYSEESFEKSKYSDDKELAKIKFFLNELESGSLKEILNLYKQGNLSLIDYEDASKKDALNPQTIITINGSVNTADFQYPLKDNRNQQYGKLILGLNENSKITEIKAHNKNFISLVQSSNSSGDGISAIKKKIEFYSKNKPVNDPNADYEKDNSYENSLNQ